MRVDAFQVVPALPERIEGLRELAFNLLWTWDEEIRVLFPRLDRELWQRSRQNPVLMLGSVAQEKLEERARDRGFLSLYDRALERLHDYLEGPRWWDERHPDRPTVAYFCAEFGLTECLPIYSGGLGVLAGHHLKSASDLGFPLVGIGLLYQEGYFRQYLSSDGWQQESYPINDFYNLPVELVTTADGAPVRITLSLAGSPLVVQVWRVQVGRVPLFVLDTNVEENQPPLHDITDQLYGGDQENRIRQEIVLGIGGVRALDAMGLEPAVCHMNEGHSAFLGLERIRLLMQKHSLRFAEAYEAARAGAVFTTHTPVPAGFDVFPRELMARYFSEYARELGIGLDAMLAFGRGGDGEGFNMAALALRTSAFANGVSRLHGEVSRRLLAPHLPGVPMDEVPVGHVTNGAHTRSCVSREMAGLFDRYLGPDWWRHPGQLSTWEGVDSIPDEELWATHERRRERLVAFARSRLERQLEQRGASQRDMERARGVLSTRALTIGFARRFASYKRADLILRDRERLRSLLLDPDRPVQIIFAGKAHPRDNDGKELLKSIVSFCQEEEFRRHAVFLEDYDLEVARYLVQGVDVWLNTPRRGMEASGTSGMKVLPNGGLNLSILDGWWCEGCGPDVGWAIGKGEVYEDHAYQDAVESSALYERLEKDIVPLFYGRQADGLPRAWIARMKRSMRTLTPAFNTNRMIWEYGEHYYRPAAAYHTNLTAEEGARARALAAWKERVRKAWSGVRIDKVEAPDGGPHRVGDEAALVATVQLGALTPDDVAVEIYHGALGSDRQLQGGEVAVMHADGTEGDGSYRFVGAVPCQHSGMRGWAVRVRPYHPDGTSFLTTGLLTWWEG